MLFKLPRHKVGTIVSIIVIVGVALQIGGWTNEWLAYGLFILAGIIALGLLPNWGKRRRIEMCFETDKGCLQRLTLGLGMTSHIVRITPYRFEKIHRFRVSPQRRRCYASSASQRGHRNEDSGIIRFTGISNKTSWYLGQMSIEDDKRGGLWVECKPPIRLTGADNILFELEIQTRGKWRGDLGVKIPAEGDAWYIHRRIEVREA